MITAIKRYDELVSDQGYAAVNRRFPDLRTLVVATGRPARPGPVALANSAADSTSAEKASNEMDKLCREFMKERGVDWNRAWSEMSRKHPELIQAMHQGSGSHPRTRSAGQLPPGFSSQALDNNAGIAAAMAAAPPMTTGPGAALFGLRPGVPQSIMDAAYRANGNHMPPPLEAAKVFEAVAQQLAKEDGISLEEAITKAKTGLAHDLWKLVEAAAQ